MLSAYRKKMIIYVLFFIIGIGKHICYGSDYQIAESDHQGKADLSIISIELSSQKYRLFELLSGDKVKPMIRKKGESIWRTLPSNWQDTKIRFNQFGKKMVAQFDSSLQKHELACYFRVAATKYNYIRGLRLPIFNEPFFERGVVIEVAGPYVANDYDQDLNLELSKFNSKYNLIPSYKESHDSKAIVLNKPVLLSIINPNDNLGRWFRTGHLDDYRAFKNQLLDATKNLSTAYLWYDKWSRTYFSTWYYDQSTPEILITQNQMEPINLKWEDQYLLDNVKYFNAVIEYQRLIDHCDTFLDKLGIKDQNNTPRGMIVYFLGAPANSLSENELLQLDQQLGVKQLKAIILPFLHYETDVEYLGMDQQRFKNLRIVQLSLPVEYKSGYFTSISRILEDLCQELMNP